MEKIERALEEARKKPDPPSPSARGPLSDAAPISAGTTVHLDRDALVRKRVIAGPCGTLLTDAYKVLRTQIEQKALREGEVQLLMVTSALDGEGKTLTALNLAISFSQQIDRAVLLVETDLRQPSLKEILGLDPALPGLADHILDRRPIEELLVCPGIEGLTVVPAGRAVPNSPELLGSQRMKDLLGELRRRFVGWVMIFDTPPLLEAADGLVFSEMADAIVLVVEAGRTPVDKVNRARQLLQGRNLLGLILNKAR